MALLGLYIIHLNLLNHVLFFFHPLKKQNFHGLVCVFFITFYFILFIFDLFFIISIISIFITINLTYYYLYSIANFI